MKFEGRVAIAAAILLVSGCGGDGGTTSGGVTIPSVTPTPTPSPTPTPTPAPNYAVLDFRNDWRAAPPFAYSEIVTREDATHAVLKLNSDLQLVGIVEAEFTATTPVAAHFADFIRNRFSTLSDKDILFQNDRGIVFSKRNEDFSTTTLGAGLFSDSQYRWQYSLSISANYGYLSSTTDPYEQTTVKYDFITGSITESSDFPVNTIHYMSYLTSGGFHNQRSPLFNANAYLTLNPTAGTLSGTYAVSQGAWETGTQPINFRSTLSGRIDPVNHLISGDIVSDDGDYQGKFRGYLYGPKGKEIGLIFYFKRRDGYIVASGTIQGYAI